MKTKALLLGVIITVSLFQACKKEQGPQGPPGKDGNANVTAKVVNINQNDWISGNKIWYVDILDTRITESVINNGMVKIFMESSSQSGVWLNLPWFEVYEDYTSIYNFNCGINAVRIFKEDTDAEMPSNPGFKKFKIVVIDGVSYKKYKEVNYNDYNSILQNFNVIEIK
ncbi:MAG: hypothetical protein N2449_05460 [Bacteroidales bacterium]|nr:hypothetical protein [Bacteroidales bacterium]